MKAITLVFVAACSLVSAGVPEGKSAFETKCQFLLWDENLKLGGIAVSSGPEQAARKFKFQVDREVIPLSDQVLKQMPIAVGTENIRRIAGTCPNLNRLRFDHGSKNKFFQVPAST